MSEKTLVAGWVFWVFFLVLIMVSITTVFKPFGMWWDRQVQLESHQYKEARATENAIFKSQLVAVQSKLQDPNISEQMRNNLKRQESMLVQQMYISRTRAGQEGIITKTINGN